MHQVRGYDELRRTKQKRENGEKHTHSHVWNPTVRMIMNRKAGDAPLQAAIKDTLFASLNQSHKYVILQ